VQTYFRIARTPSGFQESGLLAFHITPPAPRYPRPEQYLAFHDNLLERIRALPGVTSVAYSSLLPFDKENLSHAMFAEGVAQTPENTSFILFQKVSPEYTRTLGLPLLSGRELTAEDREGTPRVALINKATADKLFAGQNPIGKRVVGNNMSLEIVGVVGNKRHRALDAPPELELFVPRRQEATARSHWIVVRTDGDPESHLPTLRRIVKEMEPGMAFAHPTTLSARIHESVATERFRGFIFSGLSGMAALVAIIGVWSLLVFTVLRRTREIGIRMTLGLNARAAQREVVFSSVGYALTGVALGELTAWLLSRSLNLVVFAVPRVEPMAFLLVALVVVLLAALAAAGPARRVSRIDPMVALR
jgi:putative ABC transport system permease protein